jgi:putative transcriptional regulator
VTTTRHLDEATVMAFAAGTLGEAHAVVATAHLAVCPSCRSTLREMEAIGGLTLASQPKEAVSNSCREATLASLDGVRVEKRAAKKASVKVESAKANMPDALARLLGNKPLDQLAWKKKAPGIAVFDVPMPANASGKLKLVSLAPGMTMPEHGHGGEELTYVLSGSYSDHTGSYAAGDVADLDEDTDHMPIVDGGETCICLIAIEAPAKYKSIWARLAQPFVGI